jgi:hypothetical protein
MMEINKGSQEGFMQWLGTFEDNGVIGYAASHRLCPLHNYLMTINSDLNISVGNFILFWNFDSIESEIREPWQDIIVHNADKIRGALTKKKFLKFYQLERQKTNGSK